jgi:3-dehydroquinate synthase
MQSVRVALERHAYDVLIGAGLLGSPELLLPVLASPRVAVVTNDVVAPLYLDRLVAPLRARGLQVAVAVLPDGEAHKDLVTLDGAYAAMLQARCDRATTVVALGGGVVGDMAGFVAATYMRGVPFVQIPTTLLAQVDSSVGGKTGVNHALGKNMIGAFHQPVRVLADTATLDTLPPRELAAGLAEVIKHGLIRDLAFFEWLEANMERLAARDADALAHAIRRSVEIKAEIVARDPLERGERALLNLGHTFGHAIEAGLGFGTWLHGEAVGAGMVMAAELSAALGHLEPRAVDRVRSLVRRAGLPEAGPALGPTRYRALMSVDKKARAGVPRFVLLKGLGHAYIEPAVPDSALNAVLARATGAHAPTSAAQR